MANLIASTGGGKSAGGGKIDGDSQVTMHFSLRLDNGELIDGTQAGAPATFKMGDGSLLPGFEAVLVCLRAGDEQQFELAPPDAFGEHNPSNVQTLARNKFSDIDLEPGLLVSFAAADGELPGLVLSVDEHLVEIDFNHPLAGRHILFEVTIVAVGD